MMNRFPQLVLRRRSIALAAVACSAGLLAGCGGGSSLSQSPAGEPGAPSAAPATPAASEPVADATPPASDRIVKSRDRITKSNGSTEIVTGQFLGGHDTDEKSPSGAKPIKPCSLVPATSARAILGSKVKVVERPQGPTCIFSGAGPQISLVVEQISLRPFINSAKKAHAVTAAKHHGWCVKYESTSVVFGIGGGRVLSIAGPCAVGVKLAAVALPRISS
jgi:hypothetical protein